MYQTLIAVDCLGEIRGDLAESWKKGAGGRRWTFELRPDARFWDGEPVTAWDVEWWWQSVMRESPLIDSVVDSIAVVDERVVDVYFRQSYRNVPPVLSSTEFAVAAPSDSEWPLGSGSFQPEKDRAGSSRSALTVQPAFGETGPVVRFVEASVRDARDLLDGRVDVMITADHAVIEYAGSRPHLSTAALPWDRTYVLLSTSRAVVLQSGETPGDISQELCDGLATDAVRNDARGHESPFWWQELDDCVNLSVPYTSMIELPMGVSSITSRRILFDRDDPAARDIAERIVALAAARSETSARDLEAAIPGLIGDATGIVAEGVSGESLALSLRAGGDFAYVFAMPARPVDPCAEARGLFRTIPWLTTLGSAFPDALIPLVETRRHVIANTEHVGVMVDWFGDVFLFNGVEAGDDSS